MSQSQFSSLPEDITWQVLARVPKCKYPLLACASKNLALRVRSREIHKIRSLLDKDSLYLCFMNKQDLAQDRRWFTLRSRRTPSEENQFVSINVVLPGHHNLRPSIVSHGPEIFFICKPLFITSPSSFLIFDSRSGVLRQGPSMHVNRTYKTVGVVGRKIYVVGGVRSDENVAESFDLRTQTAWETAPIPGERMSWLTTAAVSLDRKVCALMLGGDYAVCYDTKDGSCESFDLPEDRWWKAGACVMDNVLYVYYARFGLMWYDTELMLWRVVSGLDDLKKVRSVGMAEYYGKLALLWKEHDGFSADKKEIWCRMIALGRCEEGVSGAAESAKLLGCVPRGSRLDHCLSVSD
ncbi:F-box/kelch-repeat protein At2g44700-like [Raphanus sativus]|uniref:F-box/kelch-repeat protein At2g44700-like n=1 Tax=Raphanus sativus TaxID=3726 RepID=A0A6J0NCC1_RAPSA|nr:F-box/kelch-repeat protein At2g44700-like [Raphanus sativus]